MLLSDEGEVMNLKFLFIILLSFSCLNAQIKEDNNLELRWLSASKIIDQNKEILENVVITRPEGTWQHLFSIDHDCVFYRVPSEIEKGELKIKKNEISQRCDEFLLEQGDIHIKDVSSFSYSFENQTLKLNINDKTKEFLFLNSEKKENHNALFQSDLHYKRSEINFLKENYLPTNLKEREFCHQYTDNCSEIIEYQCERCVNGIFTQVINSSCQRGYSKICGDLSCGNLNEPACIRGFKASGVKEHCVQGNPLGFCHNDLRVRCVDGMLICSH